MVNICFYFQVHQPRRIRKYTIFDIKNNHDYFDDEKNKEIMNKVSKKCYLPMNMLLLELIKKTGLKVSFSITGTAIEQFKLFNPEVLESFKELAKTKNVEFLGETYYHSLASIFDEETFIEQIKKHEDLMIKEFKQKPKIFRNTELIYSNIISELIADLGYEGILTEGAEKILLDRSPNFLYENVTGRIKLLLKNYRLSDDIAFRFSDKNWKEFPLTAKKFASWINAFNGSGEIINLFMDYETFGEHQWAESGIFDFFKDLIIELKKHPDNRFITPSEAIRELSVRGRINVPKPISWADIERDLSAWMSNNMQLRALKNLYLIKKSIKKIKEDLENFGLKKEGLFDKNLFEKDSINKYLIKKNSNNKKIDNKLVDIKRIESDWNYLSTSDHFYYMCTKYFNDGDVHKYFNPYTNPYDSYIYFMNIINDIRLRLGLLTSKKIIEEFEEEIVFSDNSV